jgi:hypothetical protein
MCICLEGFNVQGARKEVSGLYWCMYIYLECYWYMYICSVIGIYGEFKWCWREGKIGIKCHTLTPSPSHTLTLTHIYTYTHTHTHTHTRPPPHTHRLVRPAASCYTSWRHLCIERGDDMSFNAAEDLSLLADMTSCLRSITDAADRRHFVVGFR